MERNHGMGWHADAAQRRCAVQRSPARIEFVHHVSSPTIAIHVPILIDSLLRRHHCCNSIRYEGELSAMGEKDG